MRDRNGPGWSQAPDSGHRPEMPPDNLSRWSAARPTQERAATAAAVRNGVDGWQPDPFGTHEERFYRHGEPTPLVRDGGVGSYDDAPPPAPSAPPPSPHGSQATSVGSRAASMPDTAVTAASTGTASPPATSAAPTATPDQAGWYQLPDQPDMARYWNGREWEGVPQPVEEIQHGVASETTPARSVPAQPQGTPTRRAYRGARLVSSVFKVVAWLIIVGGAVVAFETAKSLRDSGATHDHIAAVVVAIAAGTVLAAAALAFFAYVLDLLIGIASNTGGNGSSH